MRTGEGCAVSQQAICHCILNIVFLSNALIHSVFGSWLARTDPKDVARVESKTVIVTKSQRDTIPIPAGGAKSQLGNWMSESDWQKARQERFPSCMAGMLRYGK